MKKCTSPHPPLECIYASLSEDGTICNYVYYCDYQLPRDSRNQSYFITQQDDVCICVGIGNSGNRCTVCGKRKQ